MKEIAITELKRKLEVAQKEKDGIQLIVEKHKNALNKLIDCDIVDNCKKSLDEFAVKPVVKNKSSEEETKAVRKNNDAIIIEEWVSDDEEENVTQPKIVRKIVKPSIVKKEFVKPRQQEKSADYKEIDGGYVAFGRNPKREKITGKEAINTACYVQNRVLIVNPHNKTLYELFHGRTPTLSFMRPFGCPVNILNTKDHLGKFDGKADEGFFVGYLLNSKAFRVFNRRTRIMEENLHIRFSENTPNVVGSGPYWLFDIDALTRTMNYEPIVVGTQSNGFACTKASDNAGQTRKETETIKDYILLLLWTADPTFSQDPMSSQDDGFKPSRNYGNKVDDDPRKKNECNNQEKEDTVSSTINAAGTNEVNVVAELPFDPDMPTLEDVDTFDFSNEDEDDDAMANMNNLDTTIQMDVKSALLYGKIEESVQDKYVAEIIKKFRFTKVKNASTPMETQTPMLKDEDVCVSAKYQVNIKVSHLHAVKRIFKYLKGQPKLSLWYPKDSPFDLVAYTDSDYAGASLDRKSTTGENPTESEGFEHIVDLLSAHILRYALTVNPTIYDSCIEQFWSTAMDKTTHGKAQIHAWVDGKEIIITESSVRRDLRLADDEGVDCLLNSTIFENLELMGITDLFPCMLVRNLIGEGSTLPTDPQHTLTILQLSSSQPQKTQKPRKPKRKNTQVPQSSGSTENVTDEAVYKELDDRVVRAATTASSLEVKQDSEIALAQALMKIKTTKPKAKGIVLQEPSESITTTTISLKNSQDNGKAIMIKEPVKLKKNEQIRLDEEAALRLQAEFDDEERLAREKA
nr:retrovirus-related Pol polyprotein from transposon TNT 1-94 [Tanacetum cinerariifolium]